MLLTTEQECTVVLWCISKSKVCHVESFHIHSITNSVLMHNRKHSKCYFTLMLCWCQWRWFNMSRISLLWCNLLSHQVYCSPFKWQKSNNDKLFAYLYCLYSIIVPKSRFFIHFGGFYWYTLRCQSPYKYIYLCF